MNVNRDVAIVGVDNTSFCRLAQNSLSSVDQFAETLGESAAEMVLERIHGRVQSRYVKLQPYMVVRNSSVAPDPDLSALRIPKRSR